MSTLPPLVVALRSVLTTLAHEAAQTSGFVQRRSKLTGALCAQTLVFGWLATAQATLEERAQTAAARGLTISPQGLAQRCTARAAPWLQQVLQAALLHLVGTTPVAIPLFQRCAGVYVLDTSTMMLPNVLSSVWPGCGGSTAATAHAALKVQVRWNLTTGTLDGVDLPAGRAHDSTTLLQTAPLPAGARRVADLGYFALDMVATLSTDGTCWLSRLQHHTTLANGLGQPIDLLALLTSVDTATLEGPIYLGAGHRVPARRLAVRVPQQGADQRRPRVRRAARAKGWMVPQRTRRLAAWTLRVTNVLADTLTVVEARVLLRVRWQRAVRFKVWKSHGRIDESCSAKAWRVLCEVYATLCAMVIHHWVLLTRCWQYPARSVANAAQTVQKHALQRASTLDDGRRVQQALAVIQRCLACGCRIHKRKQVPHTYPLLLSIPDRGLA